MPRGPDHPWIDSTRSPLLVWTVPAEVSDAELEACIAARERWAETADFRCAWVVDLTHLLRVSAKQRRVFAQHLKRFEPHDIAHNQGSALVIPNAVVRGIVTAVFWLAPPKFPNRAFDRRGEAIAWAEDRLSAGGGAF